MQDPNEKPLIDCSDPDLLADIMCEVTGLKNPKSEKDESSVRDDDRSENDAVSLNDVIVDDKSDAPSSSQDQPQADSDAAD